LLESVQKFISKVCTKQCEPHNSLRTSLKLPLLGEKSSIEAEWLGSHTFAPLTHLGRNLWSYNNFYLQ